jgi:hypothetical protein
MNTPNIPENLSYKLQALKQDEAFQFLMSVVTNWKEQATNEMAVAEDATKMKDAQSDYRICSKLLVLPDRLIEDLKQKPSGDSFSDFDAYSQQFKNKLTSPRE